MKTKEEIQQQVAERNRYKDWVAVVYDTNPHKRHKCFNEAMDLYAALFLPETPLNIQEDILDIIRKSYNKYTGTNEAELHMSEDISDYVNELVRIETDKLRPIKLTKDNVPDGEVIGIDTLGNIMVGRILFDDEYGDFHCCLMGNYHLVTHFMYKPEIKD